MHTKVSGKPDAGEWAQQFIRNNTYCRSDWLTKALSDFQRETLLWAAQQLDNEPKSNEGCSWNDHAIAVLRHAAESCGREK